jgi:2-oxo-4-hydroxy-4-carboxy-5-ureidoimidazoline decarboxylase
LPISAISPALDQTRRRFSQSNNAGCPRPERCGEIGPAARDQVLTADSAREQAAAGLYRLTPQESARLTERNAQYRARFGFPFIICTLRHSRDSILAEFARRLDADAAAESCAALAEIARITALRLVRKGHWPRHAERLRDLADASARYDERPPGRRRPDRALSEVPGRLGFVGGYSGNQGHAPFLSTVPIRFTTAEPEAHYHIPLLFTPWSYSTQQIGVPVELDKWIGFVEAIIFVLAIGSVDDGLDPIIKR